MTNKIKNQMFNNNSMFTPTVNNNLINSFRNSNNNIITPMNINNGNNNMINSMINNSINPMININNNSINAIINRNNNNFNHIVNNNNIINPMNNINNNIINPMAQTHKKLNNNYLELNNLKNLIDENYNESINPLIKNEINFIFQELNPTFNSMNQENLKIKQIWENLFLTILNKFNEIKKVKSKKEEKSIIINYYNRCKIELYFDLELKIENIIAEILSLMGYDYGIKIFERIKKNQTTKYIIENPLMKLNKYYFDEYNNFYFQFKDKNLYFFLDKSGYEIGLEEGKEILLKLNNDYIMGNFKISKRKYNISFIFDNLDIIDIEGYENELLISLIKRFCKASNIDFELINKKIFIIFRANKLNEKDYIKKIEQLQIKDETNFFVFIKKDFEGDSKMIDIIDNFSEKIKTIELRKEPPIWRQIKKGLNIFGICDNSKCDVY